VVTAHGESLSVSKTDHPDLFWAASGSDLLKGRSLDRGERGVIWSAVGGATARVVVWSCSNEVKQLSLDYLV